jgi:hypothetical protein
VDIRLDDTWHNTYFIDVFQATDREGKNGLKWLVLRLKRDFMAKKTSCRLLQRCNLATCEYKDTMLPQTSIAQDKDTTLLQMSTLETNDTTVDF